MIEVAFSSSFKRAFEKRIQHDKQIEDRFWHAVDIFIQNPFDRKLKTHRLSGKLKEVWSFRIDYDVRVLFYFISEKKVVFFDIGKHDEVY